MATHSFSLPTIFDFNMLVIFILKMLNKAPNSSQHFYRMCLLDHAYEVPLAQKQNAMPKVTRKSFNMGEAWNPVLSW